MKRRSWETGTEWIWKSIAPLLLVLSCASAGRVRLPSAHAHALSSLRTQENTSEHRLEKWCVGALSAQTGRCTALQRLLEQAEQSKTSSTSNLEADAAALAETAQRQRVASDIQQREAKQKLVAAELRAEDTAKDVAVLQRLFEEFRTAKKDQDLLAPLLQKARAEEQRLRHKVALVQEGQESSKVSSGSVFEEEYSAKRKAISQALQQQFTTERSVQVLTAALQDESVYLADLQTLCDLGTKAHQGLEAGPLILLNKTLGRLFELSPLEKHTGSNPSKERLAEGVKAKAKAQRPSRLKLQGHSTSPAPLLETSLDIGAAGSKVDSRSASLHQPTRPEGAHAQPDARRASNHLSAQGQPMEEGLRPPPTGSQTTLRLASPQLAPSRGPKQPTIETMSVAAARPDVRTRHEKKTDSDSFMGGVYDSASGNMPAEYEAWTPDGSAGGSQHSSVLASGSPTKSMLAMLGDGGHESPAADEKLPAPAAKASVMRKNRKARRPTSRLNNGPPTRLEGDAAPVAAAPQSRPAPADAEKDAVPVAASSPPPPRAHPKAPQRKQESQTAERGGSELTQSHASASAASDKPAEQLDFKGDEAVDKAFSAPDDIDVLQPKQPSVKLDRPLRKRGSLMQETRRGKRQRHRRLGSGGGDNLPAQYSAWNPEDEQAPTTKDASLEQMLSDFQHDEALDAEAEETAKAKHSPSHPLSRQPGSQPPVSPAHDGEANVVYDDDDLPKHTAPPISLDLRGGWRSFVNNRPSTGKAHKPKLDPDVAIMNNLYSSDGGLPQQYAAWKPSADDADTGAQVASQGLDVAQAPVTLAQLSSITGHQPGGHLVQHRKDLVTNLNTSSTSLANALLEHYSEVLQSKTLGQLASAHLTKRKLAELWQKLQMVDPLEHQGAAIRPAEHQAQAARWCQYFLRNEQAASPLRTAVVQLEKDQNSLAESTSQHAAIAEEIEARQQLVRTMNEDVESLSTLLNASGDEEGSISSLRLSQEDLAKLHLSDLNQLKELLMYHGALETYETRHLEILDLLEATLKRRNSALKVQRDTLSQLRADMVVAEKAVAASQAQVARSTDNIKSTQHHLEGIGASCSKTLSTLQQRQHRGHLEAHAVELALQVFEGQ